jgi:hypothetical protein
LLTTCKGFLDYENLDLKAYRAERLKVFVAMLGFSASPVLCRVGRNSEAHNTLRYCALPEWPLLALRRQQCLGAIFGARAAHVVPLGPVWVIQGFDQIPLDTLPELGYCAQAPHAWMFPQTYHRHSHELPRDEVAVP